MALRPNVTFLALSASLALLMSGAVAYLLIDAIRDRPGMLLVTLPLALSAYPFAAFFARQAFAAVGTQIELDDEGFTWVWGPVRRRIDGKSVVRLSHGPFDRQAWIFHTADGKGAALSPAWYGSFSKPDGRIAAVLKTTIEQAMVRLPSSTRAVVPTYSSFERAIHLSGFGMGLFVVLPLGYALATVPSEFVPLVARVLAASMVLAGTAGLILLPLRTFRARTVVTGEGLTICSALGGQTLPLSRANAIRHDEGMDRYGQPEWSTTVAFPSQTVVLSSRQEGYFEARAILSRAADR